MTSSRRRELTRGDAESARTHALQASSRRELTLWGRGLAVAVLAVVVVLLGATPASAHAQLVSSTPGEGAVVDASPAQVTLEFNERVEARAAKTRVFTGDGAEVEATVTSADRTVTVTPENALPEGTIVVSWAVTSADGHEVDGSLTFAVGAPTPGSASNDVFEAPTTTGVGPSAGALFGLAGAAAVVLLLGAVLGRLPGRPPRGAVDLVWWTGLTALVLAVPLANADRTGRGWEALGDWEQWVNGWVSWRGLVLAGGALAAAYVVSRLRRGHGPQPLVAAGALTVALATVLVVPGPSSPVLAGTPAGDPVAEATSGDTTVRVELDSVAVGTTGVTVYVEDGDGQPVRPFATPRLRWHGAEVNLGAVPMERVARGVYVGTVTLPRAGEWTAEISVRIDEFTNPVLELPFRIGTRSALPSGGSH